jgi:addiction module HigA family antidote
VEEFLNPLEISQYRLAKDIRVDPQRINEMAHGERAITAHTALRLARSFGTTARFWIDLQAHHDLEVQQMGIGDRLDHEVKVLSRR